MNCVAEFSFLSPIPPACYLMTLLVGLPERSGGQVSSPLSVSFHHGSPNSYVIWRMNNSCLWSQFRDIVSPRQQNLFCVECTVVRFIALSLQTALNISLWTKLNVKMFSWQLKPDSCQMHQLESDWLLSADSTRPHHRYHHIVTCVSRCESCHHQNFILIFFRH
jgi:hypothetical protein